MKSYAFLFWAYNAVWILLALFLFGMIRKLRTAERRLSDVERELERRREG